MTPTTLYFIVHVTIEFMLCKNLGDMSSNLSTVSDKSYGEAKTSIFARKEKFRYATGVQYCCR